ncbi:kelch-like protein [Neorhizobium sp. NCHU2750]|uniref:Kelch repeat-containing protein n=1 Tax=Neorhizobium sp. NCHU2750 TaxID=1825976 RepID=UPI000E722C1D|nr:galactose oxidase [Neorhizobium sp. NCHU2750]
MNRRRFLLSGLAMAAATPGFAQSLSSAASSPKPYGQFDKGGALTDTLSPDDLAERVFDSSAPKGPAGTWLSRAALPTPESEMGGGAALNGKIHIVGGWGSKSDHFIYDAADDKWMKGAPLPRGGNHVPVTVLDGRLYALGGFAGANRDPFTDVYVYDPQLDRWSTVAPLLRGRGAGAADVVNGRIHLVGGATSWNGERTSISWHEAYDPKTDKWSMLQPIPGGRDHLGVAAYKGNLHAIGGRFNLSSFNSDFHHAYHADTDSWEPRAPMPTPRSAHGLVVYRDRLFAMGGEASLVINKKVVWAHVFGQMESYDPATDTWQQHAGMPTPRHGPGAAVIADMIYTVGGGPVAGGALQAATNEAFTLA